MRRATVVADCGLFANYLPLTGVTETQEYRVVGLVADSHIVNHVYLVALAPVIDLVADDFGVSVAVVGLVIGVQDGVVALLQLPSDYLSDARSRTPVPAISFGFGAAGIVAIAFTPSRPWLLASRVLLGVGIVGHHPAHYPLLAIVSSETNRGRAYSLHTLGGSLGSTVSYATVTGVGVFGSGWCWTAVGIAVFGTAFALAALPVTRGFPE